jgi:hypothetical protein
MSRMAKGFMFPQIDAHSCLGVSKLTSVEQPVRIGHEK